MKQEKGNDTHADAGTPRRLVGALLSGAFWAAVGLGMGGLWDRVYLIGVPVHHGAGALVGLGIGALAGTAWGLLVAWPRRWSAGVLLSGTAVYAIFALVSLLASCNLAGYPDMPGYDPKVNFLAMAAMPLIFLVGPDMVLAALLRGILHLTLRVMQRWQRAMPASLSATVLLLIAVGLGVTWVLDFAGEAFGGERMALREVHRYCQDRGWKNYTLELEGATSGHVRVRVTRSDARRVHVCRVSALWMMEALGDTDRPTVTCEP